MKVKKRNILEIVLQSAAILMLFIPGVFLEEYWWWDKDASTIGGKVIYHGVMQLRQKNPISFFGVATGTSTIMVILGFAAFAVTAAALILMIRQLVSKGEASNRRSVPILSVFSLVMLIVFSAAATFINQDFTGAEYRYGMNWMFYLLAAVYLAAALVSVIGYRQAKRLGIQAETADMEQAAQRSGSADELLKYKRLLDEGTISEEEFTEIKKRLL